MGPRCFHEAGVGTDDSRRPVKDFLPACGFLLNRKYLFVVNGTAVGTDFSIVYTMVNPNNVVSLSVLQGSDATLYGTRGANGVIVIRTK